MKKLRLLFAVSVLACMFDVQASSYTSDYWDTIKAAAAYALQAAKDGAESAVDSFNSLTPGQQFAVGAVGAGVGLAAYVYKNRTKTTRKTTLFSSPSYSIGYTSGNQSYRQLLVTSGNSPVPESQVVWWLAQWLNKDKFKPESILEYTKAVYAAKLPNPFSIQYSDETGRVTIATINPERDSAARQNIGYYCLQFLQLQQGLINKIDNPFKFTLRLQDYDQDGYPKNTTYPLKEWSGTVPMDVLWIYNMLWNSDQKQNTEIEQNSWSVEYVTPEGSTAFIRNLSIDALERIQGVIDNN